MPPRAQRLSTAESLQVSIPQKLEEQLKAGMQEAGIPIPETQERWQQAMTALKVLQRSSQTFRCPSPWYSIYTPLTAVTLLSPMPQHGWHRITQKDACASPCRTPHLLNPGQHW